MGRSHPRNDVVALWGKHRRPPVPDPDKPSNDDKGVRELMARGLGVRSIFPRSIGERWPAPLRKALGSRGLFFAAIPQLLLAARRGRPVIYTSDFNWVMWVSLLRRLGLLRNEVMMVWAGLDIDFPSLEQPTHRLRQYYEKILEQTEVCWVLGEAELRLWQSAFPFLSHKFRFWPMFIDVAFYASIPVPKELSFDAIAIGNDPKRDWSIPLGLAARGWQVAVVSQDPAVARRIEALDPETRRNLHVFAGLSSRRSAEIVAASKAVLVATLPNHRFSGSTTVAMAAVMRKPVVLDEEAELDCFGLVPGRNCLLFSRGSLDEADAAVRKIVADHTFARALGQNIGEIVPFLDIRRFGQALADYVVSQGEIVRNPREDGFDEPATQAGPSAYAVNLEGLPSGEAA